VIDGSAAARRAELARLPRTAHTAETLSSEVQRLLRVDLDRADRLAEACVWLAQDLGDAALGDAYRQLGHVASQRGRYREALRHYAAAVRVFERHGADLDVARVRLAAFYPLAETRGLAQARRWAREARAVFAAHGDWLRVARVDANMATLLFRHDRYEAALRLGTRALHTFHRLGAAEDAAITGLNTAARLTALHAFSRAQQLYERTLRYCARQQLPLLLAEAEGNLAYLHAQRGEYARALELYQRVCARTEAAGQDYLAAVLRLDEAELLVELNALDRATTRAAEALTLCQRRRFRAEGARAQTLLAIAAARQQRGPEALERFGRARRAFERDRNDIRIALTDLYTAIVLHREGQAAEAALAARAARRTLEASGLGSKAALADLLLARVALEDNALDLARVHLADAGRGLRRRPSPAVAYQAAFLRGEIEQAAGEGPAAHQAYRRAHRWLERLRSHLAVEELRISFLDDKAVVYASMARAELEADNRPGRIGRAFTYVEQAKSRALADLLATGDRGGIRLRGSATLRTTRATLNASYRELDRFERTGTPPSSRRLARLRARARDGEARLARLLFDARRQDPGLADLQGSAAVTVADVQRVLGETKLVEYCDLRGALHAFVIDGDGITVHALGPLDPIRRLVQLTLFNLIGLPGRLRPPARSRPLEASTAAHLRTLHDVLVAPLHERLRPARPLVIAAHGPLHRLPFHALIGPDGYLGEACPITVAPSAAVFTLVQRRPAGRARGALVLGVPDARAPHIADEARQVADLLGGTLLLGRRATAAALRARGPGRRIIHVATHGFYRDEHPMFSSIRLANTRLDVFDLYTLRLRADLVTLSGCSTGVSFVAGGDELLGLMRGLLHAGAACVQLSLWDVDDESTAHYMRAFYTAIADGASPAAAAQRAAVATRATFPHPFNWAPFIVAGRAW
jgi:hypothetical protein